MVTGATREVNIEEELKSSYLDYAMSVIVSRALPDVRDGLKPVQRRILFAMQDMGLFHNTAHKKSARIVGEVLGKYHPHGDAPVYDAMVRMAQDFSMRYPLIDGQGNFGSIDNDPPAAMRYTEARLSAIAEQMLVDIDKETVDFVPNFDDSLKEPSVLPSLLPNLLVNGSSGIAVGMATSIPPHNLSEVCEAINYLVDNPEASVDELMQYVKGPDFPTAGIILGRDGIRSAYATGHGRIVVRARAHISDIPGGMGRKQIVVTEIPYQTNKAALVERIATLVKDKKITGISEVRDESDRQGMRIVIELKREAQPPQVLNQLYKHTAMQSAFFVNMLALVDGQPLVISLKEALQYYIQFRQEVITRRSKFELAGARARAHILEGLKIAIDQIDAVIKTIRESETAETARKNLMTGFGLSQVQAQAILDMQLRRLANLERNKILEEYEQVLKTIAYLEDLLANKKKIMFLIKEEVSQLKAKYGDPRRTEISEQSVMEFAIEEVPHEKVVVTLSQRGFIKRVPAAVYRSQHRRGKGVKGMGVREADAVKFLCVADTHDNLFFFTNLGKVYHLKAHEIPADSSRTAKGLAIVNLFPISEGERITAVVSVTDFKPNAFLLMATEKGEIKKSPLEYFESVRSSGIIAMDLEEGDELVAAGLGTDEDDVVLITEQGQSIRFPVKSLRSSSRTSGGVRGIRLEPGDKLVSMDVVIPNTYLLVVTDNGYGKLTPIEAYKRQSRGGVGIRTLKVTQKTGKVAAARLVKQTQQLMIISRGGMVISTPVKDEETGIPVLGRSTQGVIIMRVEEGDCVAAIAAWE
ncbi:MAG: DNA gyrase subunit A [Dehalococcoidales bacterium]|jgi:DNA gyrase subunit A|nr:DNA gyrase subunit A [Dehalococcoidales bacterium]